MGFNANMQTAAAEQSLVAIQALLLEQQETNRLLRKLAGEPQPEFEASDIGRAARASRQRQARGN